MSNDNLEVLERPSSASTSHGHKRPISSTELGLAQQLSDRERRFSAPPGDRKTSGSIRDSVGSIEYLSEGQGWKCSERREREEREGGMEEKHSDFLLFFCTVDSDDEESVQSEVRERVLLKWGGRLVPFCLRLGAAPRS